MNVENIIFLKHDNNGWVVIKKKKNFTESKKLILEF